MIYVKTVYHFLNLQLQLSYINWDNLLSSNNSNDQFNSFMEHIKERFISTFPIKNKILSEKRKKRILGLLLLYWKKLDINQSIINCTNLDVFQK